MVRHVGAETATELERRSELLDSLDDVVANTATFLSLSPGWDRVWNNEQGPVLEDLQSLRRLCHEVDSAVVAENGSIAERSKEEREWVRSRKQRLDDMTSELEDGSLQPSAALDELDEIAKCGLSAEQILDAAVFAPHEFLRKPGLVEGAPANLIVTAEDPRRDHRALRDLDAIMLRGEVVGG